MNIILDQYKIGPVNIDVYYEGVNPLNEPPQVKIYRRKQPLTGDLVCYVKDIIDYSPNYNSKTILFIDNKGLSVSKYDKHIIFEFATDAISYVKIVDYDTTTNTCYIYIINNNLSEIKKPHLIETTQMQIILMQYLYGISGFLLHTSAIEIVDEQALCFTGHSGAGKSTLSRLFDNSGYNILTDETAIIWVEKNCVYVSGTPWKGSKTYYYKNKVCSLKEIYLIEHGPKNYKARLEISDAVNLMAKQTFPYFWDMSSVHKMMKVVTKTLLNVGFYELQFIPDQTVVNYVINNSCIGV